MKNNSTVTAILIISSLLFTYSCGVCDPRESDKFAFYITKNSKDLFIDTSYNISSIKLFDQNYNNNNYQLPLQIDTSLSFPDSIIIFSSSQLYNYFDKNGVYKYLLEINSMQSVNVFLQITKHKSRCGNYYTLDKVNYNDKVLEQNNYFNVYQIKID